MPLPLDEIFIPVPAGEPNSTPILKWMLSRPNAHLLPLHLLTSHRSLFDVVAEETVGGDEDANLNDDGTAFGFQYDNDISNRFDCAHPEEVAVDKGEISINEEKTVEETGNESMIPASPTHLNSMRLESATVIQGECRVAPSLAPLPIPPSGSFLSSLPPLPPLLFPPSEMIQLMGLSELLLQQQRSLSMMPPTLPQSVEDSQHQGESLLLQPLHTAQKELMHDLHEYKENETIDVVGESCHYTPVLPPSPVYAPLPEALKKNKVITAKDDVTKDNTIKSGSMAAKKDDLVKKDKKAKPVLRLPRLRIPTVSPSTAPIDPYRREYVGRPLRSYRTRGAKLALSQRQKDVISGISSRVSWLWPAERAMLAPALGITPKQVLNVFINRGGRASQRQHVGISMDQADNIIREELRKHGFIVNNDVIELSDSEEDVDVIVDDNGKNDDEINEEDKEVEEEK